jgi:wyosine [tRNA(Phe)-imidazoG37] synthetase (radical SAM superfamily)
VKRAHIFGPVLSRRLGRSLGVDLVPYKTCSLDCVYCQLGPTVCKTVQRGSFVDLEELREEIREVARRKPPADFVTLSGSGEPTLSSDLGAVIEELKRASIAPVAVLTNATLFFDAGVRREIEGAQLVVPSLDAGREEEFQLVNRPHPSLEFAAVAEGLREFCEEFPGHIWLEVMLARRINDSEESLNGIGRIIKGLKVEKVQLNTVTRPPADKAARRLSTEEMEHAAAVIERVSGKRVEVIIEPELRETRPAQDDAKRALVEMMLRRPCTLDELAKAAGRSLDETQVLLENISREHALETKTVGEREFFCVKARD